MNMMALLLNQSLPTTYPNHNSSGNQTGSKGEMSFFQQHLSTEEVSAGGLLSGEEQVLKEKLKDIAVSVNFEELFATLDDLSLDTLKEIYSLLVGHTESEISEEEILSLIHRLVDAQGELGMPLSLWSQLKGEFPNSQQSTYEQPVTFLVDASLENNVKTVQQDQEAMEKQFNEIFKQVELLLAKVAKEQDLIRVSPRMLELLEKWTALANKYSGETNQSSTLPLSTKSESISETRDQSIWRELVNAFQKRNELATNQHYHTSAKVTTKDISKWMQSILNVQVNLEDNVSTQSINGSNQPLSKVEQYVIYLNQSGTTQSTDRQLIEQFQQVMSTSRFLSLNNGVNQLSIALRPDNLGEMMVRFTEVNGEMTLKIIVSSQATRQILESNIHQLKNMFSPHQVVIEEREVMIENVQNQSEKQAFEEEEDHSHESNQDESRNFDEESETQFHEILMNQKV